MNGPCSVDFIGRTSAASGHKRIRLLDEDLIRRGWFIGSSGVASQEGFERAAGRTADPSTSLRFGRDDKGRGVTQVGVVAGWAFEKTFQERAAEPQVPPLRFAPVGMTILLRGANYCCVASIRPLQNCHPDRSEA